MRSGNRLKNLKSSLIEQIKKGENFLPFTNYKLCAFNYRLTVGVKTV